MRDLSGLGSVAVLTQFSLVTVGYLALVRSRPAELLVAAAVITGSAGASLLTNRFGRPRLDVAFAEHVAPGMSFPSGHAAMSAVVFLTLGAWLANTRSRSLEQMYILAVASLMTVLVGTSRIALGVH
jgi:undecaprenyl-diphosphatase